MLLLAVLLADVSDPSAVQKTDANKEDADDKRIPPPSFLQVRQAHETMKNAREYLPQLVSAVLKSPPAFDPQLSNPIGRFRQLLLHQCLQDPSWGIELCWLLEADVGRAWKTLFEHRQQTGRRLIVVLPAEKAAVLAKIGTEKREAFDLLQDAEQATAYGYTVGEESSSWDDDVTRPRLPSSISLRRCSHFGDTMHFIDKLTAVSSDLRSVPPAHRERFLHEHLYEINRRIRRRMVTKGDVSLDVEDKRNPHDWPQVGDLTIELLKHSVHLPLAPQSGTWPNGAQELPATPENPESPEVVRVLNIVVPESRLLASRERCPFLVHVEVVDTKLGGHDARLYALGATGLGSTVEEALHMNAAAAAASASSRHRIEYGSQHPSSYEIPPELLAEKQRKCSGRDWYYQCCDGNRRG